MVDFDRLPCHIGIIMDGNGRWAQSRNQPRTAGHREGLEAAKEIVRAASELGISYLTLYTFSTENWTRAEEEVKFLMKLIETHLRKEYEFYRENHIRVVHSGDIGRLPKPIQKEIASVMKDTADFDGLTVNLAINYGGRDEIMRAFKRFLQENNGSIPPLHSLNEDDFHTYLDCPDIPDPDLIIRTAGEQRLSNFLLWESAYAEYYFTNVYWPDFRKDQLIEAVEDYTSRDRRYGGDCRKTKSTPLSTGGKA